MEKEYNHEQEPLHRENTASIKSFNPDLELTTSDSKPNIKFRLPSISPKSMINSENKKINKNLKAHILNLFRKDNDKRKPLEDASKPRISEEVRGSYFDEN